VSSAWTGRVSAIDLTKASVLWTVEVAREPRGITILPSGDTAYVSHLVGSAVTRLDALRTSAPTVKRIELPAAPLRSPDGARLAASLGYAVTASPEGDRVFFARHALGALGEGVWQGSPSVDVLVPGRDEPLAPARRSSLPQAFVNATAAAALPPPPDAPDPWMSFKKGAVHLDEAFVQPRALAYRRSTRTLLVASEGTNVLVEVDATLSDPLLGVRHRYPLVRDTEPPFGVPRSGGAPSGVALSADEREAFVFNRSTYDVSVVTLVPGEGSWDVLPPRSIPLADDDAPAEVGKGRRLFYDATDATVSGGLGCAGCHPEGRDDGHVWHELVLETTDRDAELAVFLSGPDLSEVGGWWRKVPPRPAGTGYPRQTPMLAGRVGAQGPYGWHGESADLASRITAGFKLHRWGDPPTDAGAASARAGALIAFLRGGLVPPPRDKRALTAEEQMGKAIFESAATQCAKCHVAASDYTDRAVVPVGPVPKKQGFEPEANEAFKTPSLLFVGGTAPYFHDGRFATLEDLVEQNADRMGKTSHLGEKERKALVAFLKTL
jgi:cytochrome c peroxidase